MKERHVQALVAEIGSTTTVVNAFDCLETDPVFVGQGQHHTTVGEGDVSIGLQEAINDLKRNIGCDELTRDTMLATSSAAGGLRVTVHGLVYDMTVKAAREAALGSGGVIKWVTAGKLSDFDIKQVKKLNPNLIIIAGGTDYGERETALFNAEKIWEAGIRLPVLYAGNIQNQAYLKEMAAHYDTPFYLTDNVYPALDQLNIEPTRQLIHQIFEEHIIHSPGMEHIRDMVDGPILPTPGAVMEMAITAAEQWPDLMVVDVGGATTDIHSVTDGDEDVAKLMTNVEPKAKRTVEGDLGVYVNRAHVVDLFEEREREREIPKADEFLARPSEIPTDPEELEFVEKLTEKAWATALRRHAGKMKNLFGPTGKITVASGKDLSGIRNILVTGGALTHARDVEALLKKELAGHHPGALYPPTDVRVHKDNHYIMASLGVLSRVYPEAAITLLRKSLKGD